ncbi:endopeptidase La [Candidatus Babeliales bacterium]|nr:endopeptidase La [Candidatus Babeliales bacterium]
MIESMPQELAGHHSRLEEHKRLLPLLPLKNVVLLPKSITPIIVGRESSINAVEHALKHDKTIFITAQTHPDIEHPTLRDLYIHGTRANILQVMRMPDNTLKIVVEGICRSRIVGTETSEKFISVEFEDLPTIGLEKVTELEAGWRYLKSLYISYVKFNEKAPIDLIAMVKSHKEMDYITDAVAVQLGISFEERQLLLETIDLNTRIRKVCALIKKEIEILQTEERIKGRVQTQVEKNQREYYLNEQMKAIQKELGREDLSSELDDLRKRVKTLGMSEEALEKVEKEIKRLEQMPALSSEAVVSRHYIDWVTALPWNKTTKDRIGITQAEKILNQNHAGLKKAKERIIEFLAAKKFSDNYERSPIICLAGPPGVGKTSLGKSIADSLGRTFVRISLGGIRDEAEIRGHRRTYIGALPGKIIQAMRKAKTKNPVILLDEIDKIDSDYHGDPASALLEVLDPEQNKTFTDHFVETEFDLSNVMFITTANHIDGIPLPLYDRMEIINLSGYTEEEKLDIAKRFLIPKNLKEHSLEKKQFRLSDAVITKIIADYTKEAGVRQLERTIAKLMRKAIQKLLKNKSTKAITVTETSLKTLLGVPEFRKTSLDRRKDRIGLATGLAWTEVGGDILEIEATIIPGKGTVTLTGQLGEVMQESAHAALSYIRSRSKELGLSSTFHSTKDIHIHVPEGATPKDGPSAGITMCVALVSALTKIPVQPDVAMTGEITLRGRVLEVGGLKEKILAARQYGFKRVLLPKENTDDIEEAKEALGDNPKLTFVSNMDEVLLKTLASDPFQEAEKAKKAAAKRARHKRPHGKKRS